MDLRYLRTHPDRIRAFLLHQRIRETPVSGGSICNAQRLTLDDGASVFAKSRASAPEDFFRAEAAGLRWLRDGGAAVPEVISADAGMLVLEWIDQRTPSPEAARALGRGLAALHKAPAADFGAPWTGYLGTLPLDNTVSSGPWPEWFAHNRLEPYLRLSVDSGALDSSDAAVVHRVLHGIDELAGEAGTEPPARIHGDLWHGNLVWTKPLVYLVDPAAHGGHRETDLATLSLFGRAPYHDEILAAYQEVWPLTEGWRRRRALHQLHLLLAHTAMFGGGYRDSVLSAARSLV